MAMIAGWITNMLLIGNENELVIIPGQKYHLMVVSIFTRNSC